MHKERLSFELDLAERKFTFDKQLAEHKAKLDADLAEWKSGSPHGLSKIVRQRSSLISKAIGCETDMV